MNKAGKKIKMEAKDLVKVCPAGKADSPSKGELENVFGTGEEHLQYFLMAQVTATFRDLSTNGKIDAEKIEKASDKAMALLKGINPQNQIEVMLAIQMVGVHNVAMESLEQAMIKEQTWEGREANINYANKMLRTFTMQMEALKRYRTGGQQRVIVEHVNVNEGGQAIVGAINQGGGS